MLSVQGLESKTSVQCRSAVKLIQQWERALSRLQPPSSFEIENALHHHDAQSSEPPSTSDNENEQIRFSVTVPDDCSPGDSIEVRTPDSRKFIVEIPDGVHAGGVFNFLVPSKAKAKTTTPPPKTTEHSSQSQSPSTRSLSITNSAIKEYMAKAFQDCTVFPLFEDCVTTRQLVPLRNSATDDTGSTSAGERDFNPIAVPPDCDWIVKETVNLLGRQVREIASTFDDVGVVHSAEA